MDKIKDVKKLASELKRKADTKLEKQKIKRAEQKANEIKSIDKRLDELKSQERTQRKREQIAKLEKKLTTSGKLMTLAEIGLKRLQKEMKKGGSKQQRKTRKKKSKKN